jgi:hypothetical protein
MNILFLQTADLVVYRPFIEATSRTVRDYCSRHGFSYDCFLGLKRGNKPWHASLNRIPMLKAISDSGYDGWVIYIDADAYINEMSFDLVSYLKDKSHFALIAAASGIQPPRWWDINIGVFAVNLRHEAAKEIIYIWSHSLEKIPDELLNHEEKWGDVVDDQGLLHVTLISNPRFEPFLHVDSGNIFNYDGRFIRQVLREGSTFETRLRRLRERTAQIINECQGHVVNDDMKLFYEEYVRALYVVLLNRDPDPNGFEHAVANLYRGRQTIEAELRACLASEEFRQRLPEFVLRLSEYDRA